MAIEQYINNGFNFIRQGKLTNALGAFNAALKLENTYEMAYFGKGEVFREQYKHELALEMYNKAIEYKENNIKAFAMRALVLKNLHRIDEAQVEFKKLIKVECTEPYDAVGVGFTNAVFGQYQNAIKFYEDALRLDNKFAFGYLLKGNLHDALGHKKDAMDAYSKAIECDREFVIAYNNRGNTLFSIGRFPEAIREYDCALKINPQFTMAHNQKGNVLFAMDRIDEAKNEYNKAIEIDPSMAIAHFNRGNLFFIKKQNFKEAIKSYDAAIAVNPQFVQAYLQKVTIYLQQEKYDYALACDDEILRIQPQCVPIIMQKLDILRKMDKKPEVAECEKSLLQLTHAEIAFYDAGNKLAGTGQLDAALACYNKAIEINPKFCNIYINKGNVLAALKRYDDELKCYEEAIRINPEFVGAYNNKGVTLGILGRIEEAKAAFEKVIQLDKNNVVALNNLGSTYLALGQKEEALEYYNKVLEINPYFADAIFNKLLITLSLEHEKAPIQSKSSIESTVNSDSGFSSEIASVASDIQDCTGSQKQEFLHNFSSTGTANTMNPKISNLELQDISSILVSKASTSPVETINIVKQVLFALKTDRNWIDEIIQTVSNTICQIAEAVPSQIQAIVKILVNQIQSDEELASSFMSQILCDMAHTIPKSIAIIKFSIKDLLASDDDTILLSASKISREINKIITTKDSATQTGEVQYKFNVSMFGNDIIRLKSFMEDPGAEEGLIKEYIDKYKNQGVISPDIVYGLMLSTAILLEEETLVKHILSKDFGDKNILAYVDMDNCSPIAQMLITGNMQYWDAMQRYIDLHIQTIDKVPCEGQNLANILRAIHRPQFEAFTRSDVIEKYLLPLYEDSSLQPVLELIGELTEE